MPHPFGFLAPSSGGSAEPAWIANAFDAFLTSEWGVTSGNVSSWNGYKGVMGTTRTTNDAIRIGHGDGRNVIRPKGNLRITGYPTGVVGILLLIRKTDTDFQRIINNGGGPGKGWFIWPVGAGDFMLENSGAVQENETTSYFDGANAYKWHTIGIKYDTVSGGDAKVWIDGVLTTKKSGTIPSAFGMLFKLGDSGAFDNWELGDMAYYANPADSDMASYGADLLAKWTEAIPFDPVLADTHRAFLTHGYTDWTTSTANPDTGNLTSWTDSKAAVTRTAAVAYPVANASGRRWFDNRSRMAFDSSDSPSSMALLFVGKAGTNNWPRFFTVSDGYTGIISVKFNTSQIYYEFSGGTGCYFNSAGMNNSGWHVIALKWNTAYDSLECWHNGKKLSGSGYAIPAATRILSETGNPAYAEGFTGDILILDTPTNDEIVKASLALRDRWGI